MISNDDAFYLFLQKQNLKEQIKGIIIWNDDVLERERVEPHEDNEGEDVDNRHISHMNQLRDRVSRPLDRRGEVQTRGGVRSREKLRCRAEDHDKRSYPLQLSFLCF